MSSNEAIHQEEYHGFTIQIYERRVILVELGTYRYSWVIQNSEDAPLSWHGASNSSLQDTIKRVRLVVDTNLLFRKLL